MLVTDMPEEVLLTILENLHDGSDTKQGMKKDLLSARLVCIRLANIATRLVFRNITFLQEEAGYPILYDFLKSTYSKTVRHLTYQFENFSNGDLSKSDFWKYMEDIGEFRWIEPAEASEIFSRLRKERIFQVQSYHQHLDAGLLTSAFNRFSNLKSLRIVEIKNSWDGEDDGPVQLIGQQDGNDSEGAHTCGISVRQRTLQVLITSLHFAGTRLDSLTLETTWDFISPYPSLVRGLPILGQDLPSHPFQYLKQLHVYSDDDVDDLEFAKMVSLLPLLEDLAFSARWVVLGDWPMLKSEFLSELCLDRLRVVKFNRVAFSCAYDLNEFFLRHSQSLQVVEMNSVLIGSGSWRDIFIKMRESLNLECCEMGERFYHAGYHGVEISTASDRHGLTTLKPRAIESFIQKYSDEEPFKYLRDRQPYPDHTSWREELQCTSGICPYRYTSEQIVDKIMARSKVVVADEVRYALSRYDIFLWAQAMRISGQIQRAMLLEKIATEREPESSLQQFQHQGCSIIIGYEPGEIYTPLGYLNGRKFNDT